MNDMQIRKSIQEILLKKYLEDPSGYFNYHTLPDELGIDIETTNRNAKFLIDEGILEELEESGHHPYLTRNVLLTNFGFERLMDDDEKLKNDFEKKRKIIISYLYEEYKKDQYEHIDLDRIKDETNLEVNETNYVLYYLEWINHVKLLKTSGCAPYIARSAIIEHEGIKWLESENETEDMDKMKIELGENEIKEIRKMFPIARCFKSGAEICPKNVQKKGDQVFIGMPFKDEFHDSYELAIKPALEKTGFNIWKADKEIDNIDVMCKICLALQESSYAIINISDWNPNVMYELGLAHGLGINAFIIKDKNSQIPTDLKGLEYIHYAHATDLKQKLEKVFFRIAEQRQS